MSKQDVMSDLLVNSDKGHLSASQRIPAIARPFVSERAAKTLDLVSTAFPNPRHCPQNPCSRLPLRILSFPLLTHHPSSQVEKFVEEECIPADAVAVRQIGETTQERFSSHPSVIDDLKKKAKELGLWNMFLPKNHFKEGAGFSNLEYGLMAEYLGKSRVASEVRCTLHRQILHFCRVYRPLGRVGMTRCEEDGGDIGGGMMLTKDV